VSAPMDERGKKAFGIFLLLAVLIEILFVIINMSQDLFNMHLPIFLRLLNGIVVAVLLLFALLLFLLIVAILRKGVV
jgi:hypothetical protein